MFKPALCVFVALLLAGCAAQNQQGFQANDINREAMLKDSGNSKQLIALYQEQLLKQEDEAVRVKLATVHLELQDPESALFVVEDVPGLAANIEGLKVKAKSLYQLGKFAKAQQAAGQALGLNPQDGALHSLIGILQAEQGQFDAALVSLNQARRYFYDDLKVKNNLASVYLLKQDYAQALALLSQLYKRFPDDATVRTNLIIALVNSGHRNQAYELVKQHYKVPANDMKAVESLLSAIEQGGKPKPQVGALDAVEGGLNAG